MFAKIGDLCGGYLYSDLPETHLLEWARIRVKSSALMPNEVWLSNEDQLFHVRVLKEAPPEIFSRASNGDEINGNQSGGIQCWKDV